jgi:hypothetical protein
VPSSYGDSPGVVTSGLPAGQAFACSQPNALILDLVASNVTATAVTGKTSGYLTLPTLQVSFDNGSTYAALPSGSTVAFDKFTIPLTGVSSGAHTVIVKDQNGVLSNPTTITK